ncbi:MAG: transglycosylase domain-containing protein [Acidimicrobiales bacterium]
MRFLLRVLRLLIVLCLTVGVITASGLALAPQAKGVLSAHVSDHARVSLDPLQERSYIYDRYGLKIATLKYDQNRVQVPLGDISDEMIKSVLAVEDEHFYDHKGVNLRSIGRALSANLEEGGVSQGGSTITQQVVKLAVVGTKQDLSRKLREAFLAVELEKKMTKNEILERYLNSVYFGNGTYGAQAAAELYFDKDAKELDWSEAALLAALIRSPNDYDPIKHRELALRRRILVYRRLVEVGHIDQFEADLRGFTPLPDTLHNPTPPNDYFVEKVKQQLLDDPRLGATPIARRNALFGGGLRIYTTYDPLLQHQAKVARDATMPSSKGDGTFDLPPDPLTGNPRFGTAVVTAVEPSTGAVRVLLAGPGFDKYKYDIATQGVGRQPGSSFKTFVLTELMEQGYSPTDLVDGTGPCYGIPGYELKDEVGEPPENFGGSRGGVASLQSQTLSSSNCAYLRLGIIAGLDKVAARATRMGITTPLRTDESSMSIGTREVHPLDMAAAYSVLANDGVRNPPYYVDRVTDAQGRIILEHQSAPEQVVSEQSARLVTDVLTRNVVSGTGTRARLYNGQDAAGKTGTAQDSADVWFVGYTPQLSVSVWMGSPSGRVPLSFGGGATGGRYPAATWGQFMNAILADQPIVDFVEPLYRSGGTCLRMVDTRSCRAYRYPSQRRSGR